MKAYVLRHGDTEYKQEETTLAEADDLTPKGIRKIIDSSEDIARKLDVPTISIEASPFGRTLHSARCAADTLQRHGIRLIGEIKPNRELREVDNFDWNLFVALVNGGEVDYSGDRFIVEGTLTNPERLTPTEFFRRDLAHQLSAEARRTLPRGYLERVDSFEPYNSVVSRFNIALDKLDDSIPNHLLVGHEGYTGRYAEALAGNRTAILQRGKYFVLEKSNGVWKPISAQDRAIQIK